MTQHEVKRGERRNGWRGSQPIWGGPTKIPYVVRALGAHGHSRRFDDVRVTSAFAPIATRKLTLRRVSNGPESDSYRSSPTWRHAVLRRRREPDYYWSAT